MAAQEMGRRATKFFDVLCWWSLMYHFDSFGLVHVCGIFVPVLIATITTTPAAAPAPASTAATTATTNTTTYH